MPIPMMFLIPFTVIEYITVFKTEIVHFAVAVRTWDCLWDTLRGNL